MVYFVHLVAITVQDVFLDQDLDFLKLVLIGKYTIKVFMLTKHVLFFS